MASYNYNYNYNGATSSSSSASAPFVSSKLRQQSFGDDSSLVDDCLATVQRLWNSLLSFCRTRGRKAAWASLLQSAHQLRRNLAWRRLFSFPHVLVAVWVLVMLWGERWVFHTTVERCAWENWEKWVRGHLLRFRVRVEADLCLFPKSRQKPRLTTLSSSPTPK